MADASSVRAATTLPVATGRRASSIRYNANEIWFSNGTSWLPLASRYGQRHVVSFTGTAGTDACFFIADRAYTVKSITEVHSVAGGSGAVVQVTKDSTTAAPGAGADLIASTGFVLTGTANTVQTATLTSTGADLILAAGDRLSVDFAGTTGSLAGVVINVTLEEAAVSPVVPVSYNLLTGFADSVFFVADRSYKILAISEVHATAGTDASAVNVQVTKDSATDAPGAGLDLLTNNTSAGFNLKGTANTVQAGTLTATASSLTLAAGDRLSVDFAGVLTALAGLVVTVVLQPV